MRVIEANVWRIDLPQLTFSRFLSVIFLVLIQSLLETAQPKLNGDVLDMGTL